MYPYIVKQILSVSTCRNCAEFGIVSFSKTQGLTQTCMHTYIDIHIWIYRSI